VSAASDPNIALQARPNIQVSQIDLRAPQLSDKSSQPPQSAAKWNERCNLRADMRADSLPADPLRITVRKVKSFRLRPVQAELVFVTPRCNVRVPTGLHIGIHPNRRCRWSASPPRQSRGLLYQYVELRFGFSVEKQNARASASPPRSIIQSFTNLVPFLADSGENDSITAHSDPLQVVELSTRYNVKAASPLRKMIQDGQVPIGLHGKTQSVWHRAKSSVKFLIGIINRGAAV